MKRSPLRFVWTLVVAFATVACVTGPALARSPCDAMQMGDVSPPSPSEHRSGVMIGCAVACTVVAVCFEIALEPRRVATMSYTDILAPSLIGSPPSPSTPPPRASGA